MSKIAIVTCAIFAFVVPIGFVLMTGLETGTPNSTTKTTKRSRGKLMYFYQTS